MSEALRLYRLDVEILGLSDSGPLACYAVAAASPAAAAYLAVQRAQERWDPCRARVRRCWSYPPGELVLGNADQLELVGATPIEVADVG